MATSKDAMRYRRLRVLGCAPAETKQLEQGSILRFQNLDEFIDKDLEHVPSRGEAVEIPSRTAKEWLLQNYNMDRRDQFRNPQPYTVDEIAAMCELYVAERQQNG